MIKYLDYGLFSSISCNGKEYISDVAQKKCPLVQLICDLNMRGRVLLCGEGSLGKSANILAASLYFLRNGISFYRYELKNANEPAGLERLERDISDLPQGTIVMLDGFDELIDDKENNFSPRGEIISVIKGIIEQTERIPLLIVATRIISENDNNIFGNDNVVSSFVRAYVRPYCQEELVKKLKNIGREDITPNTPLFSLLKTPMFLSILSEYPDLFDAKDSAEAVLIDKYLSRLAEDFSDRSARNFLLECGRILHGQLKGRRGTALEIPPAYSYIFYNAETQDNPKENDWDGQENSEYEAYVARQETKRTRRALYKIASGNNFYYDTADYIPVVGRCVTPVINSTQIKYTNFCLGLYIAERIVQDYIESSCFYSANSISEIFNIAAFGDYREALIFAGQLLKREDGDGRYIRALDKCVKNTNNIYSNILLLYMGYNDGKFEPTSSFNCYGAGFLTILAKSDLFRDNPYLKEIALPFNCLTRPRVVNCLNLKIIKVDKRNPVLCSTDGVLYNKFMSVLLRVPEGKAAEVFEIPDSIKRIAEGAFKNCKNIKVVRLNKRLRSIGRSAFESSGIEKIDGEINVRRIKENTFKDCTSLKNVQLGSGIRKIKAWAFMNSALKEVDVPNCVKRVGVFSFAGCRYLQKINIRNDKSIFFKYRDDLVSEFKCDELGSPFFIFLETPLREINIIDGKKSVSDNGVIYSADGSMLIYYPSGKPDERFRIPDGVKLICEEAFSFNAHLRELEMHESLMFIEENAFFMCKNLERIYIHKKVEQFLPGFQFDDKGNRICFLPHKMIEYLRKEYRSKDKSSSTYIFHSFNDCKKLKELYCDGCDDVSDFIFSGEFGIEIKSCEEWDS